MQLLLLSTVLAQQCENYANYAQEQHSPFTSLLKLPYQRPPIECRTFQSPAVESVLDQVKSEILNEDLQRLWENCFPNTLDTTVSYFQPTTDVHPALSFIVTGDIDAEWIRDSYRQLLPYLEVLKMMENPKDDPLFDLLLGALNLQARFILQAPLCNAFQPPKEAQKPNKPFMNSHNVQPKPPPFVTFECKYELDTFSSFIALSNEFALATGDLSFMSLEWEEAIALCLKYLAALSSGTFEVNGELSSYLYLFSQQTDRGSETQWNSGVGNPVKSNGLVRSFFRPSDDTTLFQFNTAANAQLAVELDRLATYFKQVKSTCTKLAKQIRRAIETECIVGHKKFGKVYAYEVDGYGSQLLMDDANIPSLLALPVMNFVDHNDKVYKNTRKMVLSTDGNPYYAGGRIFEGIGGPHVNLRTAWPLSLITAIRTTDNVREIRYLLNKLLRASTMGLINESINVDNGDVTRPWFAWANSEFALMILDLRKRGLLEKVSKKVI